MSFDTEFGFSELESRANLRVSLYASSIADITAELAVLESIEGFDSDTEERKNILTRNSGILTASKAKEEQLEADAIDIQSLDASRKAKLYTIYTSLQGSNVHVDDGTFAFFCMKVKDDDDLYAQCDAIEAAGLSASQKTCLYTCLYTKKNV